MKHISSRDNPAVKALVKLAGTAGKRGAPVLLDGVHPVSYTHLDVYKRQAQTPRGPQGFQRAAAGPRRSL